MLFSARSNGCRRLAHGRAGNLTAVAGRYPDPPSNPLASRAAPPRRRTHHPACRRGLFCPTAPSPRRTDSDPPLRRRTRGAVRFASRFIAQPLWPQLTSQIPPLPPPPLQIRSLPERPTTEVMYSGIAPRRRGDYYLQQILDATGGSFPSIPSAPASPARDRGSERRSPHRHHQKLVFFCA